MKYCGLNFYDTANGAGIRVSLFVSGCRIHCPGCFNQESWDFDAGELYTKDIERKILKVLENKYIAGISILGGDPFEPEHEETLLRLLSQIPAGKSVWVWTGHRIERIRNSPLLSYIDVLVDGPFVQSKKVEGEYFGSSNQRVIYLKEYKNVNNS